MIDQLYPVQPSSIPAHVSARRLPTAWLWATRVLWSVLFLMMFLLNIAAVVSQVQRNAGGIGGGSAGLKAVAYPGHGWVLTADPLGPAAQAGIKTGDTLLAIDGIEIDAAASYQEMNQQLYGTIGEPLTLTFKSGHGELHEVTVTLVEEDALTIWRRFRLPLGITSSYLPILEAVLLTAYLFTSLLIFWRRSDDWLALYLTLTLVLITPQLSYSWYYLSQTAAHWESLFHVILGLAVALTLPNFYLLPTGRFVPRWTIGLALLWVLFSTMTEIFPTGPFSIYRWSGAAQLLVWLGWYATGMLAQVYRYRVQATPTERQQIKWIAFGLTVAVIVNLGWTLAFELFPRLSHAGAAHRWMWLIGRPVYVVGMMTLPVAFGIAVFRYRLWDIDNLINRTLVYGALTAIVVGIYVVIVSVFDVLFSSGQLFSQIIAISLDLVIFEPLRNRLQNGVDHLMFGEVDDLPAVIKRLGQRLTTAAGADAVLPIIVDTLTEALKLPYVAIALPEGEGFQMAAASGDALPGCFVWPLVYHKQLVGQLILAPRALGEPFKPAEWQMIENISYHVSVAVHDILLEHELNRRRIEES